MRNEELERYSKKMLFLSELKVRTAW